MMKPVIFETVDHALWALNRMFQGLEAVIEDGGEHFLVGGHCGSCLRRENSRHGVSGHIVSSPLAGLSGKSEGFAVSCVNQVVCSPAQLVWQEAKFRCVAAGARNFPIRLDKPTGATSFS